MTREEDKKAIEVIQAYIDGRKIQSKFKGVLDDWEDISCPIWDFETYDYRIKPESKVRPYTYHELCDAIKKHGGYIVHGCAGLYNILFADENCVFLRDLRGVRDKTYIDLSNDFVWLDDNTSCGAVEKG